MTHKKDHSTEDLRRMNGSDQDAVIGNARGNDLSAPEERAWVAEVLAREEAKRIEKQAHKVIQFTSGGRAAASR